jgi:hypothetical protein
MNSFELTSSMFVRPRYLPPSAWVGHLPFGIWLVEQFMPRVLVELGTHTGASYMGFCQAVQDNGLATQCFAVDTWMGDEHAGYYGEEIYQTLKSNHNQDYAGFSQLLRMTFDDALINFDDGSIDLLHIDGLHTYDAVRHDFETWLPKLSQRGVVLFHDTMVRENDFGVWKLWKELSECYPSFEFTHSHGLGVLAIGSEIPDCVQALLQAEPNTGAVRIRRLFETLALAIDANEKRGHFERLVVIRERELAETREAMVRANESADSEIHSMHAQLADAQVRGNASEAELLRQLEKSQLHIQELTGSVDFSKNALSLAQNEIDDLRQKNALINLQIAKEKQERAETEAVFCEKISLFQSEIESQSIENNELANRNYLLNEKIEKLRQSFIGKLAGFFGWN